MAGTILSVTVPEMTTRSAWRGLAGNGMTPRRITSYRGDPKAAPISMAQHARPHWYTQREYLRAVLSSLVSGCGTLPLSTSPIRSLDPTEDALTPGVEESEGEDHDEDGHLDQAEDVVDLEANRPREDEHGLDVEQHEQDRKDVVADLALRPAVADGIDA